MDEVHFQQHGSRCRMWVPPEADDPVCLHAPTRKSISFFGAVRLADGKLVMSQPKGMFDARPNSIGIISRDNPAFPLIFHTP